MSRTDGGTPWKHNFIREYNRHDAIICVGQGDWEVPGSTRQLQRILEEKGILAWVDYWGCDVKHDWDWWYKQVTYFLPYLLKI